MGHRKTLILLTILAAAPTHRAVAQCGVDWKPAEGIPGINGQVLSLTEWDPDGPGPLPSVIVAGGAFTVAGKASANHIAYWDGQTWNPLGSGLPSNPYALAVFDGQLIAASTFTGSDGTHSDVGRWDGTQWQPLGSLMLYGVSALFVYHGQLYAGGWFGLAVWSGFAWTQIAFGEVDAMVEFQDELAVAGEFSLDGQHYTRVATWDGSAWTLFDWLPGSEINALAVYQGQLIVGGSELEVNYQWSPLVRWNGSAWEAMGIGITTDARALSVYQGELVAGGLAGIARWDGNAWHTMLDPGDSVTWVWALLESGDKLVAGGNFSRIGGRNVGNIAKWSDIGWRAFPSGFSNTVQVLSEYNHELVAGGGFFMGGGIDANFICHWDGSTWRPFGSGLNDWPLALTELNGDLVAGGWFTTADGQPAMHVARWDGASWLPLGDGLNDVVWALTVWDGQIIAGGDFTASGNTQLNQLARWTGQQWEPIGDWEFGSVSALTVFQNQLVAGGSDIWQWDGSDWIYLGSSGYSVKKLAVWNGRLIAGDSYDIAAWDGTNWESLGSLDDPIYSFGFWNGSLFAVGLFGSWMNPSLLAQWNGSDWIPTTPYTPVPQTQSTPFTMLSFAGDLYVGGDLAQVGTYPSSYLARMGPVLPFPQIAQGPASPLVCEGGVVSLQVTASGEGKLSYQWQKSGHNLTDSSSLLGTQTDTLVVAHAQLSDSGVYTCVVTLDGCAQHTTDGATLTVFGGNSADGNQDGLIDARDIQPFIDAITNFAPVSAQLCAYDLTGEGIVSLDDLPPFVTRLLAQ